MSTLAAFHTENPAIAHLRYQDNALTDIGNFNMQCHLVPDTAVLQFVGEHKRPVVRLKGMVTKLTPTEAGAEQAAAYGIEEITFNTSPGSSEHQPRMVCDYVFDNNQLKELIDKGLYEDDFAIPTEYLTSNELRVPMDVSLAVTAPEMADGNSVLLYNIEDIRHSEVDLQGSGFDLAAQCEAVRAREAQAQRQDERQRDVPQQQAGTDMFADVAYAERETSRVADRSFDASLEQAKNTEVPFVERLQAMAPDETLDFIEVYEDAFPSEDFVPEDVIEQERKLEESIKDQETSPLMKRFYAERDKDETARKDAQVAQPDLFDELEASADSEDEFDLDGVDFDELDVLIDDVPEADAEVDADGVADDRDDTVGDRGEDAERESLTEALQAGAGEDDLFADEDFGDEVNVSDNAEQRKREQHRRATALSNDSIDVAGEQNSGQQDQLDAEGEKLVGDAATDERKQQDEAKRRERERQRKIREQRKARDAQRAQDDGFSL